jgi:nucleoside-diphosphate-sugar epimerase
MSGLTCLTGATGFVGRHVFAQLSKGSIPVRVVTRPERVDLLPDNVDVRVSSALFSESEDWWVHTLDGVDTVIHLAWIATPGEYLDSPMNHTCLNGSLTLARAAVRAGVRRFVGIGTCFEYEMTGKALSVASPLQAKTLYSGAKLGAFFALSGWFAPTRTEFAWCRLFHIYGEGEDSRRLVPYIHQQLAAGRFAEMTSGSQIRDFLPIEDAATMICQVASSAMTGAVNICSGKALTVRALAEAIADGYVRRDLLRFGAREANPFDPPHVVGMPLQQTLEDR